MNFTFQISRLLSNSFWSNFPIFLLKGIFFMAIEFMGTSHN